MDMMQNKNVKQTIAVYMEMVIIRKEQFHKKAVPFRGTNLHFTER